MTGTPTIGDALEPGLGRSSIALDPSDLGACLDPLPRHHPPCRPGERAAAVLALLRAGSSGPELLLVRRAEDLEEHAGQIAFPGGRVEVGDADPGATALREAWEESGLPPGQVRLLGALGVLAVPVSRHRVVPLVGWLQGEAALHARTSETAEVWFTPLGTLIQVARAVDLRGTPAWDFPLPQGRLWGMTALVVGDLLARLGLLPIREERVGKAGQGPSPVR